MLQEAIASVEDYDFEIESILAKQLGAVPLPFPGMDKNKAPLCEFFLEGTCNRGSNCPYRHIRGERVIVCKHWLRQLCNKGDDCEFLHEYDMGRMPVCYFYQKFGECNNKDCQFMHIDADTLKVKDCPWYDRGFCKHGPLCRNRHTRRVLCQKYLISFCPDGSKCRFVHPRYELPGTKTLPAYSAAIFGNPTTSTSLATTTPVTTTSDTNTSSQSNTQPTQTKQFIRRPLHEVTCFKCGEKGHYANMCPKSFRAMQLGLVGTPNVGVK